jgi:hypothetical protein
MSILEVMYDKFNRQNPYLSYNLPCDDNEDDNNDNKTITPITRTVVVAVVAVVIISNNIYHCKAIKNSDLAVIQKYDQMHTSPAYQPVS